MAKKPGKPEMKNNDKKRKPDKERAFLFGTKKWQADEYFGDDDLDLDDERVKASPNNSFFADDEAFTSNNKSSASFYAARKKAAKDRGNNFISDDNTAKEYSEHEEPEENTNIIEEESEINIKDEVNESSAQKINVLTEDHNEAALEDKPKRKGLFASRKKEPEYEYIDEEIDFQETDTQEKDIEEEKELLVDKQRQTRKSHNGLLSRLEKVEFEETELPEEVLMDETISEQDDFADEAIVNKETKEKQELTPKTKRKGLFSRLINNEQEKALNDEEMAEEEPEIVEAEEPVSFEGKQSEKPNRRRKGHNGLLARLQEEEFEQSEIPEEVLIDEELLSDEAERADIKADSKRRGLFARFEEDDEIAEEFEERAAENEITEEEPEQPKKRSFISHFLKDEGNRLSENEAVHDNQEEAIGEAEEDIVGSENILDMNQSISKEDAIIDKPDARRKGHKGLLTRLQEERFEETDIPEEVLAQETLMEEQSKEEQISLPKKRRGLFARYEEEDILEEAFKDDETDLDEDINISEPHKRQRKGLFSRFVPDEAADEIEEALELDEATAKVEEDIAAETPAQEVKKDKHAVKPKRMDKGLLDIAETFYFEGTEDVIIEEEQLEKEESIEKAQPKEVTHREPKVSEEVGEELSADIRSEDEDSGVQEKKIGWLRRFFYNDMYDEELLEEHNSNINKEDENLQRKERRNGLFAFFYGEDELDESELSDNEYIAEEQLEEPRKRRGLFARFEERDEPNEALADNELTSEEDQHEQPRKRKGLYARLEEDDELDEALAEEEYIADEQQLEEPRKRKGLFGQKKKQKVLETTIAEEAYIESSDVEKSSTDVQEIVEPEQKRRAKKPVGTRGKGTFPQVLAGIKNILPSKKSDKKALTFAEVSKQSKKNKTRRIFIYAGSGVLAIAIALFFIFTPLGQTAATQPDDETMIAIADATQTDSPTEEPIVIPSAEPTHEVVQTPIVTTAPDPTHRTINIDKMVEELMVDATLYYNEVGYSTNYYKYTENEMYMLAQLIHGEARGETLDGMVAVGNVVMNRVLNRGYFGNNMKAVITAAHQFSGYKSTIVPSSKCKIAARKVLDFQVWVVPQNVYYFKAYGGVGQDWGSHKYYTKIGGHYFYTHRYGGRSNTDKIPPRMFERTYKWPRMGCKAEERVYRIQYMLNGLGYDVVADSYYGEGTMEELKKFQEKKGLDVDGVAGPSTIEALIRAFGLEAYYDKFYT